MTSKPAVRVGLAIVISLIGVAGIVLVSEARRSAFGFNDVGSVALPWGQIASLAAAMLFGILANAV